MVNQPGEPSRHGLAGERLEEIGSLNVHLVRAVGLMSRDRNGKSDPYVSVSVGKVKKKSRVVYKTLDPVWNETLSFDGFVLHELVERTVLLQAFDYDGRLSKPDALGELRVGLEQLRTQDKADFSMRLSSQGSLVFSVEWIPSTNRQPYALPAAASLPPPSPPAQPPHEPRAETARPAGLFW